MPEALTTAMDILAELGVPFGGYANAFTSVAPHDPGGTVDVLEARKDLDPDAYADHVLQLTVALVDTGQGSAHHPFAKALLIFAATVRKKRLP